MLLYKRQGLPEEGELLLCTVTNIQYHSVFVQIEEYGISGMIHISEIAAGRIRNIHDYVKTGKVIVCKVLRVHEDRGHVDLSLRRVTDSQRRNKVDSIKREQIAESIIQQVSKQNNEDLRKLYDKISAKALVKYPNLSLAFEDVVEEELSLESLGIDKKLSNQLEELIKQRIKPKEVLISGNLALKSYDPDGIGIIKSALEKGNQVEGVDIRYLGGGKFKVTAIAKSYKYAEPNLKKSVDIIKEYIESKGGELEFKRDGK